MTLLERINQTIVELEEEINSKERHLKRELEGYYILHNKIIKLLKDDSTTDHDKIETLKNYFIT